jgi:outer membrane immunogenic protein
MNRFLLSTAVLALISGAALAADLPARKAPAFIPPPPPPPMWTGFYAGLNAGYGFGTNSNIQAYSLDGNENWGLPINGVNDRELIGDYQYSSPHYSDAPFFAPSGVGSALSSVFSHTQSGFIGGGQIGYNFQWGSSFVVGLEADMQGTGIRGTSRGLGIGGAQYSSSASRTFSGEPWIPGTDTWTGNVGTNSVGGTTVNAGVDWLGTVRARLGYLWTPTLLTYATGGLTYGGVYANAHTSAVNNAYSVQNFSLASTDENASFIRPADGMVNSDALTQTFVGGGQRSSTLVGWNAGGGLEWMFMPNWSLKAEAIYWNMGNMSVPTYTIAAPSVSSSDGTIGSVPSVAFGNVRVNYQGVIARAGINYHFNWGAAAPVVAAY